MKRPAATEAFGARFSAKSRKDEQAHRVPVFAWPSIAAVCESLPFWADKQQQASAVDCVAACAEQADTDISLSIWERHHAAHEQQELSLRCYGCPEPVSDDDTEDTATSSNSEGSAASLDGSAVLLQACGQEVDSRHLPVQDDDSISSSMPHKTSSAAFSFRCLPVESCPALELGWFARAATVKLGAQ